MDERLLSPGDLATRVQVPLSTIYNWNSGGTGPAYFKIGRHVRYRIEDVIRWEDERRVARPEVPA